jgi:hypothetical protein
MRLRRHGLAQNLEHTWVSRLGDIEPNVAPSCLADAEHIAGGQHHAFDHGPLSNRRRIKARRQRGPEEQPTARLRPQPQTGFIQPPGGLAHRARELDLQGLDMPAIAPIREESVGEPRRNGPATHSGRKLQVRKRLSGINRCI